MHSELIYEFEGTQDINATPLVISGLDGDTYDYHIIYPYRGCGGASNAFRLTLNGDGGANYSEYYMRGVNTSVQGSTLTRNFIDLATIDFADQKPSLNDIKITGDSAGPRKIKASFGFRVNNGTYRQETDGYWNNSVDNLTSLTLTAYAGNNHNFHIRVYRTLKVASSDAWEKVETITWSAESTIKTFTGLDGDRDEEYRISWSLDSVEPRYRINGDNGANYRRQHVRNANGAIASANFTENDANIDGRVGEISILSKSGIKRPLIVSSSESPVTGDDQERNCIWWSNTVDNITSIDVVVSGAGTGSATLYRKKKQVGSDLPWETLEIVDIPNINFSAGHTFTGLKGNDVFAYRWIYEGEAGVNDLLYSLNGDTNNSQYPRQYLFSGGAGTSAAYSLNRNIASTGNVSRIEFTIYTKSGNERPYLCNEFSSENRLVFNSGWWNNTGDEITSLKVNANTTTLITGTLKLQVLR